MWNAELATLFLIWHFQRQIKRKYIYFKVLNCKMDIIGDLDL